MARRKLRNYGYFNPGSVLGAPAPPGALQQTMGPVAPRRMAGRAGLRRDMGFMRQVLGGMIGFAGMGAVKGLLEDNFGMTPFIARVASGGVIYGGAFLWSHFSADSPMQKKQTRDAILVGIGINIALYLLGEVVGKAKNAVGLEGYTNLLTPERIAAAQEQEVYQ